MATELGELQAELRAAGMFQTHELRGWLKLVVMLAGVAACLVAIATFGWIAAPLVVPAGVLSTSIAMMGHEGSHGSFSRSHARNTLLNLITYPLFSGLGALYWRDKHDSRHHSHPNVEGMDPDIRPFPFALSRRDHEASSPAEQWFQRHCQAWLFWPMTILMPTGMRRSSLLYFARYPKKRELAWWLELLCHVLHYAGWIVVPAIVWGPKGVLVYLGVWAIGGICLALVFAPAHMGLPIVRTANHDWEHQLATTRDLQLPRAISFFFIGLDYQVEHHLCPRIPHRNLPAAAAITRAWCARHGAKHLSTPYLTALAGAERFMRDAWSRHADDAVVHERDGRVADLERDPGVGGGRVGGRHARRVGSRRYAAADQDRRPRA